MAVATPNQGPAHRALPHTGSNFKAFMLFWLFEFKNNGTEAI